MTEKNKQPVQAPGYLDDDKSVPSSKRLMSMITLFASIGFGVITIFNKSEGMNQNGLFITFGFLLAAFAPKALQKFAEARFQHE